MFIKNILSLIYKTKYIYIISIIIALTGGYYNISFLISFGEIITNNFIKIFKFVSIPIISLSLIVTLSKFKNDKYLKDIWKQTMYYTISTTLIASTVACLLYIIINPGNINSNSSNISSNSYLGKFSYFNYLDGIIPSNILTPFIEHQVIGVLIISVLIGISISFITEDIYRNTVINFFAGIHALFIVMTSWIIKIMPLGLFGFIITTINQLNSKGDINSISKYLLVVVLSNILHGIIILPILLYFHNIKPISSIKGMFPALSMAFFSKSSSGTLPITINSIENNLNVSPEISRFVLPLCTSINMNGCAAFIFSTVIYLLQNNGVAIDYITMIIWIIVSSIAAIGNAGVPMGCFFLSASLLTSMNVSIELLGLILPFYGIIDMIETSLNVWSDACITQIIDKKYHKIKNITS
ncbi:dicarboxylate/amino acid:cation symporter [Lyticum sinuosum]|uniref:Dicarboxylate/amino acid:cation symporter n=1 Tax=Lyticum sinuosum TaxID=1332059 RepID=A0AAE5AGV2_9RICK|nr:dicarboxylate/amino acid:cation symporter [Lyticum sinuosum]MDZ5761237.1 Dicarboxylate/amino acid:cation symporter [Lyticum sinuosum]